VVLTRMRIILALASPFSHRRHLTPLLGSGAVGLLIVGVAFLQSVDMGPSEYLTLLRVAAATLATGAAFLLNDPAMKTTSVLPVSRATRYIARMLQCTAIVACWWAIVFSLVSLRASDQTWHELPKLGLLLEGNTMLLIAVTAAAWLRSLLDGKPGLAAGTLLLGVVISAALLPTKAHVLIQPGDPRWVAAQRFWGLLFVGMLVAFALAARERTTRGLHLRRAPDDRNSA
jgi:hypothetical protein